MIPSSILPQIWSVPQALASLLVLTLSLLLFLFRKRKSQLPPLPPDGLPFDDFLKVLNSRSAARSQRRWVDDYGEIFTIRSPFPLLIPNQVVITDPKLVKELCINQANMYRDPTRFSTRTPKFASATRNTVGVGVTGLLGEEWRWRKEAILKEFHKKRMLEQDRGLIEKIVAEGKKLCASLDKAAQDGEPVMVDVLTTRAAVSVILYFLFGRELQFDAEALRDSAKDLMECLMVAVFTLGFGLWKQIPGTHSHGIEERKLRAWKTVDDVVAAEIAVLLEEQAGTRPVSSERKPGSVIASLIANEPRFRQGGVDSMIAEARVFVQAGFETTAHSLAFSFGMMAERPDLADGMAAQGRKILGEEVYDVTKVRQAVESVDLVKNFFLESVRLYPLAPALGGICTDNLVIESAQGEHYGLPKGTAAYFPNVVLQRHPLYSRGIDPNAIEPDRWNVKPSEQPFLHTFNTGPHTCPGKPLSMLEGQIFLLLAAVQFEFAFPEGGSTHVEFQENLLLRPKDGMPLVVKRRVYKS